MFDKDFEEWLITLRRKFHRIPELRYEEHKTSSLVHDVLNRLGVEHRRGVGGTGIVAFMKSRNPGPTVALRADMDALPLLEAGDVPYKSEHEGFMHACGHDGHMTMALGVVRRLKETNWEETGRGGVIFFFQPAEEGGAGARAMIEAGALEGHHIDAIFAVHLHPELPTGHVGLALSASHAACDNFNIRIVGKGGHGAHPDLCRDPIVAGAQLVTLMQTVVSRGLAATESAVVTVGKFQAGTARNIIPHEAVLEGTVRTLDEGVRQRVLERMKAMVRGMDLSFGVSTELEIRPGYPLVLNDRTMVDYVQKRAEALSPPLRVHIELPSMGSEDFAFFLQRIPGALIRLGCHDPDEGFTYGLHSPYFDFDERALGRGVALLEDLLVSYS